MRTSCVSPLVFLKCRSSMRPAIRPGAAQLMREQGVACVIVIGGDGTNRVVTKGSGSMPLVPLSTGTNNAFPQFLESTLAGLAAGYYAVRHFSPATCTRPTKRLNLYRNGMLEDIALVDAAVCDYQFVGARAVWEAERSQRTLSHPGPRPRTSAWPQSAAACTLSVRLTTLGCMSASGGDIRSINAPHCPRDGSPRLYPTPWSDGAWHSDACHFYALDYRARRGA